MSKLLWTQKQDVGPSPRIGHAMAFDADRGRTVLFGGNSLDGRSFNDTWEWDGGDWTQMADIGPSPRSHHALAYDSARKRVVLFGGSLADNTEAADTWEWDGDGWTQVADTGPLPRAGHAMAFDSVRSRIVLFGGEAAGAGAGMLADTWEWDGETWTQIEDIGLSARRDHVMAYHSGRRRVVLFGGQEQGGGGPGLGDTWEWDGVTWTLRADYGITPVLAAAMASKGDGVVLFGGIDSVDPINPQRVRVLGGTWIWDGKHWTQRQDMGPSPRWRHALAYDRQRDRVVLFGGLSDFAPGNHFLGDTWELFERGSPGSQGAAMIDSLVLSRSVVTGADVGPGNVPFGTVTLTGPAPAGGAAVQLQSTNDKLLFMGPQVTDAGGAQLTLPANATAGQFQFVPRDFTPEVVEVRATLGGVSKTTTVRIAP